MPAGCATFKATENIRHDTLIRRSVAATDSLDVKHFYVFL